MSYINHKVNIIKEEDQIVKYYKYIKYLKNYHEYFYCIRVDEKNIDGLYLLRNAKTIIINMTYTEINKRTNRIINKLKKINPFVNIVYVKPKVKLNFNHLIKEIVWHKKI